MRRVCNTCSRFAFGRGYPCPKCLRDTKWFRIKAERAYSCQFCGHHLHPTVGTPFESSRTPLQLWFYAIYLFTTSRYGVSGKELERQLDVTYKCAYRMGQEIRKHMAEVDGENPPSGTVEIDETLVGGVRLGKGIVFGMLQRDGEIITKVVPNVKHQTVMQFILEHVKTGSTVNTDEFLTCQNLKFKGYKQNIVNHSKDEFSRRNPDGTVSHVNGLESFWKLLKTSIKSTHVHVSENHLAKYANEFEFRYKNRKTPRKMFLDLISKFAKP